MESLEIEPEKHCEYKTNYCHSPLYTNSSKAFLLPQDDAFKSYVDAWLSENQNFVEEVFRKYTE